MEAMSKTCTKIITSPSPRANQTLAPVNKVPVNLSHNARKERPVAAARCVASGSSYAAAMEPITPEEEEELTQRRGICGGEANSGGVRELLECLEKEAIMGEDDGRDPKDYNRRAKIFDKSSKIFKNIKEQRDQPPANFP